jgi:methyl-accepting chemotaxis protein
MSATSEELAAQAEQLQASIAFFRIDEQDRGGAAMPAAPAASAAKLAVVASPGLVPKQAKSAAGQAKRPVVAAKARPAAAGAAAERGVKLDLGAGGDTRDAEFERY